MMKHLVIAPIVLPLVMVAVLVLLGNKRLGLTRAVSLIASGLNLVVAVALLSVAHGGDTWTYLVGDWEWPFGIVLVLDRLSAMMLGLTAFVSFVALLWASQGGDREGPYFHALYHMLVTGVQGAFLTGDIFNLFVFFEILLLGSYVLLLHGARASRVKAGIHYVIINLVGSGLFLIGVGTLYAFTGTLNMHDMALKVAALPAEDAGWVQAGGLILLVVFGIKAAIVPLGFWLPATYGSASAPVAAIFAVLTKVGVYAIIRVHGFVLGQESGPAGIVAEPWLLPLGIATIAFGMLGALQARDLRGLAGHLVIGSVGTMIAAVGLFTPEAFAAALYYMVHSTLAAAAFYLVIDLIRRERGDTDDALEPAPQLAHPAAIGTVFFIIAAAMVGLPPLSGFLGKLLILKASSDTASAALVWGVVLGGSLLAIIAMARAGSAVFWKASPRAADAPKVVLPPLKLVTVGLLLVGIVAWTVFAEPLSQYATAAADAVLKPVGSAIAQPEPTLPPTLGGLP